MPRLSKSELEDRRNGMGSTDVVEALGLSPWEGASPMRIYMAKVNNTPIEDDEPEEDQDWGHTIEPVLRQWYEDRTRVQTLAGGPVSSPDDPWLFATLDAVALGVQRNIEIKHVGIGMSWHWDLAREDGIPRYVRAQVTIGMFCRRVHACDVVADVGGRPPQIWSVDYDAELGDMLVSEARAFWQRVQDRKPPPLDHTSASRAYLLAKYPSNVDRVIVEADEAVDNLGQRRIAQHMAERKAKQEKARLDAEIMDRIGDRDGVRGSGWSMTWRTGEDGKRRQRFTARGLGGDE